MLVIASHDVLRCSGCNGAWPPDSGVTTCPMETCEKHGKKLLAEAVESVADVVPANLVDVEPVLDRAGAIDEAATEDAIVAAATEQLEGQPEVVKVLPPNAEDADQADLREVARVLGVEGHSEMSKAELVAAVTSESS